MGQYTKANGSFWTVGDNNQAEVVDESIEKEVCFEKKDVVVIVLLISLSDEHQS